MSAVNSLQPPQTPEPRPTEPSMEEILASIRRIIADDQSLPGHLDTAPPDVRPAPPAAEISAVHELKDTSPADLPPLDPPPPDRSSMDLPPPDLPPPDLAPVHVLRPPHPHDGTPDPSHDAMPPTPRDEQAAASAETMAYGSISAPQYARPDGPLGHGLAASPVGERLDSTPAETFPAAFGPNIPVESEHDMQTAGGHAVTHEPDMAPAAILASTTRDSVTSAFNTLAAARLAGNSEELRAMVKEMLRPILLTWLDDHLPALVERLVRDEIERVARA